MEIHKPSCLINHSGSSDSMGSEGACEIFLRSIKRNYSQFVGDGDTGSYGKVRDRLAEAFGNKYIAVKRGMCRSCAKRLGLG